MNQSSSVQMINITKQFAGHFANKDVSLQINPGEIHALLGENGAGKSTLMNILTGLYKPDQGSILIGGKPVTFHTPKEAIVAGIGMIHQHFRLIPNLTVAENIMLGHQETPFVLTKKKIKQALDRSFSNHQIHIKPDEKVARLSIGEQQNVEILKALFRGSNVLILDEPTAVLTPQETEGLFSILKKMASDGKAVVVITHKMHEVFEISDRITVLRDGKKVGEVNRNDTDEKELANLMVGRNFIRKPAVKKKSKGNPVLKWNHVSVKNDAGVLALKDITLSIHENEIVGIAGVAGNGQKELCETAAGLRDVFDGNYHFENTLMNQLPPKEFMKKGVAYIPDDRLGTGLVPGLNTVENMILKDRYNQTEVIRGLINYKQAYLHTLKVLEDYKVKVNNIRAPVKLLSGGNLQRLLFAREMTGEPRLIVASYPLRGLDIEAADTVNELLLSQRERGAAILFVSEDLDELFRLSDRIAVIFEGQIMGIMEANEATEESVGMMMLGSTKVKKGQIDDTKR